MKSRNSKKSEGRKESGSEKNGGKGKPLNVPSILLEGDNPAPSTASGPGQRYDLGPAAKAEAPSQQPMELPEAYGTQRLILTARDPKWLYAHWDLTRDQLQQYNNLSVDKHLVLRVYKDAIAGQPAAEVHVHPESRNWFVNVPHAGAQYLAQLGYYQTDREWVTISTSSATLTPPETMSEDFSVWFETLPAELQFDHLLRLVKRAVTEHVPLMEAIQQLRATGFKGLPDTKAISAGSWTPEQEQALSKLIQIDSVRRVWMGSLEITELVRRQLQHELYSAAVAQFGQTGSWSGALAWSGALSSISSVTSPFGGERQRGFWFKVNAELIIYGSTEPDAQVTIGDRVIKLRPDGTFSYRFALPDGVYSLPAAATSADKVETRVAELEFSRKSEYHGDVGKHPQDPRLKPPLVAHVG